ncbi:MAG TPA: replication-associated recombination protein A, partial [Candidatus Hydrogenedentes bacterium]|nr:replication-associated recombination protein A [Candidatus Hydrogenedentota bacterium]
GSLILYGPPGCGKTSMAEVIAKTTHRRFERMSGVVANVSVLRGVLEAASGARRREGRETILFIDEIHHFNKSQQDILLPCVEDGAITLIGATTHNPFFFVNSPLTSRSQVFELKPLDDEHVVTLLKRVLAHPDRGMAELEIVVDDAALSHIARYAEGDARRALNGLEVAMLTTPPVDGRIHITIDVAQESIQRKLIHYDGTGDQHYDAASAFIKSMRGTDPDSALYWMAYMLEAGEEPRFIARRICIAAAEDVGNADPHALVVATAAFQACEFIGLPEARIILAQAATYVACAPKSNAAYMGIDAALTDVREGKTVAVPKYLQDAHYPGAQRLGRGAGYQYAHNGEDGFVVQDYGVPRWTYYQPTGRGKEGEFKQRLEECARREEAHENPHEDPAERS